MSQSARGSETATVSGLADEWAARCIVRGPKGHEIDAALDQRGWVHDCRRQRRHE
jgi:hypothetical protein